jgi:hypothetical protein
MTKTRQYPHYASALAAIFMTAALTTATAQAQRLTCNHDTVTLSPGCTPVYFFQGGADGGDPIGGVALGTNGALYGTTNGGGVNDGTVYEMTPPAKAGGVWGYNLLYSFTGNSDGGQPQGPLVIDANGALYGMTAIGCGTVFQLTPPASQGGAWGYNNLHTFTGGSDGCHPLYSGLVIGKNGEFYGTTAYGGSALNAGAGWGTVFELTPPAAPGAVWAESVLYAFKGGKDGGLPQANVLSTGGVLYGTAYTGGIDACPGGNGGCGVVFELKPKAGGGAWKESVLYSFIGGSDGGNSASPVIMKNGVLYGATSQEDYVSGQCAWGCGTVFELAPPAIAGGAWTETPLYHFEPNPAYPGPCPAEQCDASTPIGGVVFGPNGALYGTTAYGGAFATGTIFELAPPASPGGAWTETVLYDVSFYAPTGAYTSFPQNPFAGLTVGKKGVLYGTTTGEAGMVFQLKP